MTVIIKRNGRWAGVDYTAMQSVQNATVEQDMVNAGFADWSPGSAPSTVSTPLSKSISANGLSVVDADSLTALNNAGIGVHEMRYVTMNGHKMPRTKRAVARVVGGTGRMRIAVIKDSTGDGAGAGTGGTTNIQNSAPKSYPQRLAQRLATLLGCTGQRAAVEGGVLNAGSCTLPQFNPAVTFGGGTAAGSATYACPTGQMIVIPNAGTYGYAPGYSFDTLEYGYVQNAGLGTLTPTIANGVSTPGSISAAGGFTCQNGKFTFSQLNTSVTLTGSVATNYVGWVLAYDSSQSGVDVIPCCKWGGVINDFTNTSNIWSTGVAGMWNTMSPDLVLIEIAINDSNNGTTLASFLAKYQQVITLLSGLTNVPDIAIKSPWPSGTVRGTDGTLAAFQQGLAALAAANGIPYIAFGEGRIGAYANYPDFYNPDAIHLYAQAYGFEGDFTAKAILQMVNA